LKADALEIAIPDDLRPQRMEPAAVLRLTIGNRIDEFQRTGTVTVARGLRSYRYVADAAGRPPTPAGESSIAKLEGTIGNDTVVLEWSRGRSAVFPFDRFQYEPTVIEPSGRKERAVGVKVRIVPEGGWPVLPVLVPDFSAGR